MSLNQKAYVTHKLFLIIQVYSTTLPVNFIFLYVIIDSMTRLPKKLLGNIPATLLAGLAFLGLSTTAFLSFYTANGPQADMQIEPTNKTVPVGDYIDIQIIVKSSVPVNAFTGDIVFDSNMIEVVSINYNTSIADLWVTEPWYSKADNAIHFAGGTTKSNGFLGSGTLLSVRLKTKQIGVADVRLENTRILQHNGFGTDVVLAEQVDALFTSESLSTQTNVLPEANREQKYNIADILPSTDLNNDGKQTFADIGIFMLKLGSTETRYDFNQDGKVNTADLSIIINAP